MNDSGGEAVAKQAVKEGNTQESGPENPPKAKKRRIDNATPHQSSLAMREEINNHLLHSDREHAADVRQMLDKHDRSTRLHAELRWSNPERAAEHQQLLDQLNQVFAGWAARFARERHASRKRKRS
jgi:hypothetical protein